MQKPLDLIKTVLSSLSPKVLASAKAFVAFAVATAVTWLSRQGVEVDASATEALVSGLYGLIVAVWVWFIPNKK